MTVESSYIRAIACESWHPASTDMSNVYKTDRGAESVGILMIA